MKATAAHAVEQQVIDEEPEDEYIPEPFAADVNWLIKQAAGMRQGYQLGDDPVPDEQIEKELLGIAMRCPCDPPLSPEVIREIARGTYKNPATAAAIAKAEEELGWAPDQKITDVVF